MNAMVIHEFGDPHVFKKVSLPIPEIKPNQVLIKVMASSINPVDVKIRRGVEPKLSPMFPAILHGDVAGVIEKVGEEVTEFRIGDEVYACGGGVIGGSGALAEYMAIDASLVALKPVSLSCSRMEYCE
jgi:NADPH2:quinone reductase